ncbi:TetR/AcrR family transcriptional regulator, partial [Streptomyces sp. CO7]
MLDRMTDAEAVEAAGAAGAGTAEAAEAAGTAGSAGSAGSAGPAASAGGGSAPRRRTPAGAAVLREDVTQAIRAAVLQELAAVGYARTSIEGVARRAGVGKTAVYRRWRGKLHLVLDIVSALAVEGLPAPDTGSLETDLRLLYEFTSRALRHPVASQIIPDLQAEAARNPEIDEALRKAVRSGQESVALRILAAAVDRGELRRGLDEDIALDLITGPLYWRTVILRQPRLPKS